MVVLKEEAILLMPLRTLLPVCLLLASFLAEEAQAQIGGRSSFAFLDFAVGSRVRAIGGENVSILDNKPHLALQNPALLSDSMQHQAEFHYNPYYADITNTQTSYAFRVKDVPGQFAAHLTYLSYGEMEGFDIAGNPSGTFNAFDVVATASYSHRMGNFRLGGNFQYAGGQIAGYGSQYLGLDLGAAFVHPDEALRVGLSVQNLGFVPDRLNPESPMPIPFKVSLGATYKLEHMPLRFSLTAQHLQDIDIVYHDPALNTTIDASGKETAEEESLSDEILRHFVVGAEFLISEHLQVMAGYSHLIRREMALANVSGAAGFSMGAMLKIAGMELTFARSWAHVAGGYTTLSLNYNIDRLFSSRQAKGQSTPIKPPKPAPEEDEVGH